MPPVLVLGPDEHFRAAGLGTRLPVLCAERSRFPDGEQLAVVPDAARLRAARVLVVQSTARPQDERIETLFQLVNACAPYATDVTCAVPYLAYGRQDKRTPGAALSGPLHLRLLGALGVSRVLVAERHSTAVRADGVEIIDVNTSDLLADALRNRCASADVVLSADAGGAARTARVAGLLGLPHQVLTKAKDASRTWYPDLPASLAGRSAFVVDDLCTTGSTLVPLLAGLARLGCAVTGIAVTHLLADPLALRAALPGSPPVVFTDTTGPRDGAIAVLPALLAAWLGPDLETAVSSGRGRS